MCAKMDLKLVKENVVLKGAFFLVAEAVTAHAETQLYSGPVRS